MDNHPEFSEAVRIGKAKCAAWWERTGRDLAGNGGGNATLVIFGLKNMAGEDWREKQEIEQTVNMKVSLTEMSDEELAAIAVGAK